MPYRERKIYSGRILEVDMYPVSKEERKMSRAKKAKETSLKQKKMNNKNAKKHLIRLLNNNFTDKDLSICLTYNENTLPGSEEDARKDVVNYLRRLKHYRKKNGLEELKYIAVIEYKEKQENGKGVRFHHHIVINGGIDRDIVESLWKKGRVNADRLQADEFGYEALAKYITKDPKGDKRWTQSRNLKQPIVKVNDYRYSNKKIHELARNQGDRQEFEKLYPGYTLTETKVEVNDITSGTHIHVKLRKQ